MLRGNKWRVHGVVLTAALAIGSGVAAAAPAFATDNMDCNWLGFNCRAFWDHGYGSSNVWSNYKHLDLSLIHISEPTRLSLVSRMPSSA